MERIRYFRKRKGWTQEQLATELGVKRSVVSKYESGAISPSVEMLKNIAVALDVHVSALYGPEPHSKILDDMSNIFGQYALALRQAEAIKVLGGKRIERIVYALDKMNDEGQLKAVERVEELAEIPRYRRQDAPEQGAPTGSAQEPPESPPAPAGDTDTPAAQDAPEGPEKGE